MDPAQSQRAIDRRNLLSQLFVVLLVGLAYQEMVAPVSDTLHTRGWEWGTFALVVTFLLTSLRFFFGAQLHLVDENLLKLDGRIWFTDFTIISLEMLVLIFLGGVASVDATQTAAIGFYEYLMALLVIDIAWVVAFQWLPGKLFASWRRTVMWKWAVLNGSLLVPVLVLRYVMPHPYDLLALAVLALLNVVVFVLDVFWADYFALIGAADKQK
jgi:hypothetical protein